MTIEFDEVLSKDAEAIVDDAVEKVSSPRPGVDIGALAEQVLFLRGLILDHEKRLTVLEPPVKDPII